MSILPVFVQYDEVQFIVFNDVGCVQTVIVVIDDIGSCCIQVRDVCFIAHVHLVIPDTPISL